MANICENDFLLNTPSREIIDKVAKYVEEQGGEITFSDEALDDSGNVIEICIEGWFESNWSFPMSDFESIIPDGSADTYFRCLSQEYGNGYVAMNIYKNEGWTYEQAFDL